MPDPTPPGQVVTFSYQNYRGYFAVRRVIPLSIWFGSTEWHKEPQWLLAAFDVEKNEHRDFAMKDLSNWSPDHV